MILSQTNFVDLLADLSMHIRNVVSVGQVLAGITLRTKNFSTFAYVYVCVCVCVCVYAQVFVSVINVCVCVFVCVVDPHCHWSRELSKNCHFVNFSCAATFVLNCM